MRTRSVVTVALAIALCLAGVVVLAAMLGLRHHEAVPSFKYGIVFDAGSSGTRLYLYRWPSEKVASTGLVSQAYACQVNGGLSSYVYDPRAASRSLQVCLDHAKSKVPKQQHASTQLYLAATAGMRLINETRPAAAKIIMEEVRSFFRSSGFGFNHDQQARIISGQEEGVAGWITVNYIEGKLQPVHSGNSGQHLTLSAGTKPVDTYGVLDLGGASTQITFADYSAATPWNYTANLTLLANAYQLYSYSFQCYGVHEAYNIYRAHLIKQAEPGRYAIEDPCTPHGYTENQTVGELIKSSCSRAHLPKTIGDKNEVLQYTFYGTGNASACESRVHGLFDFNSCTFTACWFAGVYMPSNITAINFTAVSGYYYVSSDLELVNVTKPLTTKDQFHASAYNACGLSWNETRRAFRHIPQMRCFHAQYAYTLLTSGYRLGDNEWHRIRFSNEVNGTDFNWALGYMLHLTNNIPSLPDPLYYVSQPAYIAVLSVGALLIIGGLCAAAASYAFRRKA